MNNRIKILIAFPFVFVIILSIVANYIPLKVSLTAAEESILAFSPSGLTVKEISVVSIPGDIKSPLNFDVAETGGVRAAEGDVIPETDYNNALSLIVLSGNRKMAIIRDIIVREGDIIDGMKIARIEPDRVLLKNRTERWIYLEKTK